ncbi:cytochrome c peroxidase [Sinorhizobium garamanticum]|uniref:cytochrome c peroxidase n=1 Tax=Sinorhizobium garamanticum TaxID=680247 RepID=UPI003145312F
MLYFEPRLWKTHNISCNTCHQIGRGGANGRPTSIGYSGSVAAATRRLHSTPSLVLLSFGTAGRLT